MAVEKSTAMLYYNMNEDTFLLKDFPDDKLELILALEEEEQIIYYDSLINRFYPHISSDDRIYEDMLAAYHASFVMEKLYRKEKVLQLEFTPIYTKTGLIRNLVNDLYYTTDDLITH